MCFMQSVPAKVLSANLTTRTFSLLPQMKHGLSLGPLIHHARCSILFHRVFHEIELGKGKPVAIT